ncbi:MAG: ribonuclease P protein component [Simplicispira sp.]|jgi:ribonuclease P protein component|nr:ribonuclease P protein component [Simplicispira sp.]
MQRLKTRPQFQATLSGATVARTPHFALHRLPLATPQEVSEPVPGLGRVPVALIAPGAVWLGAMVPKRWARRAVTRNAIKRQIYGVAAVFESRLPAAAHVVRLRSTFDRQQFVSACSAPLKLAVREELHALFERSLRSPL